ncbi:MAG: DinB family protein [Acidimicrobiales bacterium]|nr:DinB family protein [Acidimicrobiales bacterium]
MESGPPAPQRVPADPAATRAFAEEAITRCEATIARAASFSEDELQRRVEDEWSTVESLRHLVLVIDLWISKTILGVDDLHPMALPPHFVPAGALAVDPEARPSFTQACAVLRSRFERLRTSAASVDAAELARPIQSHAQNIAGAFAVCFDEFAAHDSFMNRDLDAIKASRP